MLCSRERCEERGKLKRFCLSANATLSRATQEPPRTVIGYGIVYDDAMHGGSLRFRAFAERPENKGLQHYKTAVHDALRRLYG